MFRLITVVSHLLILFWALSTEALEKQDVFKNGRHFRVSYLKDGTTIISHIPQPKRQSNFPPNINELSGVTASAQQNNALEDKWISGGPLGALFSKLHLQPQGLVFATGEDRLYRSFNGGKNWQVVDMNLPFAVISHPKTPEKLLAFSHDAFVSTDQGTTWNLHSARLGALRRGNRGFGVADVVYDPENPNLIYAVACCGGGFFKSGDGGKRFTYLKSSPKFGQFEHADARIVIESSRTLYVYVDNGKLFKSTNSGTSWKRADDGLFQPGFQSVALSLIPNSKGTLLAGNGQGIFKTTDGGTTWLQKQCDCDSVSAIARDPFNAGAFYGSAKTIVKTTDGGESWFSTGKLPFDERGFGPLTVAASPVVPNLVLATGVSSIFRSTNSGKSWANIISGLRGENSSEVIAHPSKSGLVFSDTDIGFEQTQNGGKAWKNVKNIPVGSRFLRVHEKNQNFLAFTTGCFDRPCGNTISFSTDLGRNWTTRPITAEPFFVFEFALDSLNPPSFYLAGQKGNGTDPQQFIPGFVKSTDLGLTWTSLTVPLENDDDFTAVAVDSTNNRILAGTALGKIFVSTNRGETWTQASGTKKSIIFDLVFDPFDSNIAYASGFSFFKTTDGGNTWISKARLDTSVTKIDPVNPSTLFSVGAAGIFTSADRGENWSAFDQSGLSVTSLRDISISPATPNVLFLGTSVGVFSFRRSIRPGSPQLVQLLPSAGKAGDLVQLLGFNFGSAQGTVRFGSLLAGIDSWSNTEIHVRVPDAARTDKVTINSAAGGSNTLEFLVLPSTGKLHPNTGSRRGGTPIVLVPSQVGGNVFFNSQLISGCITISENDQNFLRCLTPSGDGTASVSIQTNNAFEELGTFTYE